MPHRSPRVAFMPFKIRWSRLFLRLNSRYPQCEYYLCQLGVTVPGGAERNVFDSGELIDEELLAKTFNIHTCRART